MKMFTASSLRIFLAVFTVFFSVSIKGQIYRDDMEGATFIGVLKEFKDITIPVRGARIQLKGSDKETYSDGRGFFAFGGLSGLKSSAPASALIISADGYETLEFPVEPGQTDLGIIFIRPLLRIVDPVTVNELMPAGGEASVGTISRAGAAALYPGDDAVMRAANYDLGMLGFKPRGYERNNVEFYINGASFNDPLTGYADAGMFSGLNLALYKSGESDMRLINDAMFYGDVGGYGNIRISPLKMHRRFRASYIFGNSLFTHGLNAGYSTGEMPGGLALSVMLTARTGEGFAEGTAYNSVSYLFAVGKAFDEFNKLNLFVFGAPSKRGGLSYASEREYESEGNGYYNPSLGYDGAKQRNINEHRVHRPALGVEYCREGEVSQWNTSAAFVFGDETYSDLLWTEHVRDPLSAYRNSSGHLLWDMMRASNDTASDRGSHYIVSDNYSRGNMLTFNSVYDLYEWGDWATTAGLDLKLYNASFSSKVDDLLGGGYWLNIDKFRSLDIPSVSDYYQFDVKAPNRRAGEGGNIGYDYGVQYQSYRLWNIWRYFMGRFKFSFGGSVSLLSHQYVQNTINGKFPTESSSRPPRKSFFNYTLKAGTAYRIDGTSSVEINTMFGKRAPLISDLYLAPRITGEIFGKDNETQIAVDVNYLYTNSLLDVRASIFATQNSNRTVVRGYYDEEYMSRMSLGISGLNSRHLGGDLSAKMSITDEISVSLAASYGVYKYFSESFATLIQENTATKLLIDDTLRTGGRRVGGTPQMAFSLGAMYDSPQRWWAGFKANYAGNNYIEVNPLRFSSSSLSPDREQRGLKAAFTVDLYGGYTFEFGEKKKKAIGLNVNIQNLIGTKAAYLGAYEPFGIIGFDNAQRYEPRYAAAYGRTFYLMLSFVF
ncbi:MAG: hypothetical protein LBC98_08425 [Prevotellaceae bacterium]|jgi:hypothetical protein|nr:hypothetical protein [Prevotellaceae bacterium]